jgi:hypothetical protein
MFRSLRRSRLIWLGVGLVAGLVVASLWPHTPLHAVATDRYETFAIASGPLDDESEAVYFLDFLTGDLRARVLGKRGGFNGYFEYNVLNDLGVDPAKNPRYMMVTGLATIQQAGARMQFGRSVCYVAEITTGKVGAFAIPWNPAWRTSNATIRQNLVPLGVTQFRAAGPGASLIPEPITEKPVKKRERTPAKEKAQE